MREPGDAISGHVATDDSIDDPFLERLVDDHSALLEVRLASAKERIERQLFGQVPAGGLDDTDRRGADSDRFALPDALPAIASILFEHARRAGQPGRKRVPEARHRLVEMRVRAPAEMPGTHEHLFGPHLQDGVGVGAYPWSH